MSRPEDHPITPVHTIVPFLSSSFLLVLIVLKINTSHPDFRRPHASFRPTFNRTACVSFVSPVFQLIITDQPSVGTSIRQSAHSRPFFRKQHQFMFWIFALYSQDKVTDFTCLFGRFLMNTDTSQNFRYVTNNKHMSRAQIESSH